MVCQLEWNSGSGTLIDLRARDCFTPADAADTDLFSHSASTSHTICHQRDGFPRPATVVQWMDDGGCPRSCLHIH